MQRDCVLTLHKADAAVTVIANQNQFRMRTTGYMSVR
jgi:hypothetical protein